MNEEYSNKAWVLGMMIVCAPKDSAHTSRVCVTQVYEHGFTREEARNIAESRLRRYYNERIRRIDYFNSRSIPEEEFVKQSDPFPGLERRI